MRLAIPCGRRLAGTILAVALLGSAGCWYNTTGRSAGNVGNIYIPFFEDKTSGERAPNLGTRMTELVLAEFRQDRAIRVYQAASERTLAEKELLGTVERLSEGVLTRSVGETGEEYRVVVTCSVTYNELKTGKPIWQDSGVMGDGNYYLSEGDAGFQRALSEALKEILDKILDKTIKAW